MRVSEIKKIGKGLRYSLYVDDEFVAVVEAEILAKKGLRTGDEITEEYLQQLKVENGDYASFDRALSLLEKGMKTKKGIRDYLRAKGYLKSSIDKAIDKLTEYGYIDDSAFAENYIKTYSSSKGRRKIKLELLSKGVAGEIVEEKLEEILGEDEEFDSCLRLAKKYFKGKEFDLKTKQKASAHLAGKGYGFDLISRAIRICESGEQE